MKTISILLLFLTTAGLYGQSPASMEEEANGLPLQSAICDVAGIGICTKTENRKAYIQPINIWIGKTTNSLLIVGSDPIQTNTPLVFFASAYPSLLDLKPIECRYAYIFDKAYHQTNHPPEGLYFLNGSRSYFPASQENQALINWCSNLVYTSQIATNRMAFYELIRDGFRLNPPTSRMHMDSYWTFAFFHYFNDTNFMKSIWSDTNLIGKARGKVGGNYQLETQQFLLWPTNQLAPQVLE